ncbi:MAG: SH3 domain-containing protein [Spirochaetia bacterium]|nr:SH3 domain-containing protein [Spirochaetia bacterium]
MKTIIKLILQIIFVFAFTGDFIIPVDIQKYIIVNENHEREYFVQAIGGLNVRTKPILDSKIIVKIPDGEMVEYRGELGSEYTRNNGSKYIHSARNIEVSGKKGNWIRVKWKNFEGWVFGGYLYMKGGKCLDIHEINKLKTNGKLGLGLPLALHFSDPQPIPFHIIFEPNGSGYIRSGDGVDEFINIPIKWRIEDDAKIKIIGQYTVDINSWPSDYCRAYPGDCIKINVREEAFDQCIANCEKNSKAYAPDVNISFVASIIKNGKYSLSNLEIIGKDQIDWARKKITRFIENFEPDCIREQIEN